ncbi:MAG: hypothetical protein COB98_06455 [Flavobacteriaceae bacterium]|nr:MAG: hypothetical protein COB98_06455 [Flavobacteriaceae bacterium]
MSAINLLRPLMTGILHSFEPDHVTAITVLATENATTKEKTNLKTVLKASQWAFGHSVTLLIFGGLALLFKASLGSFVDEISFWADIAVGPIMLWLGIVAIRRNRNIEQIMDAQGAAPHSHNSNPMSKSFWVGMVHGLAGTGGALTSALVLSADTTMDAIIILLVECAGIIIAMGIYSYTLISVLSKFFKKNISIYKWMNGVAGVASILLGVWWISKILMEL